MKRVASLYLPEWSIDLLRRAERPHAPPERARLDLLPLKHAGDAGRGGTACDAPGNTGWRPGATWARGDVDRAVAALPTHQRPAMREPGRKSEAADHPYRRLPGDDGGKAIGWPEPGRGQGAMPSIRYPGEGPHPDGRRGSNDAGASVTPVAAFFDTSRSTAGVMARVCPATELKPPPRRTPGSSGEGQYGDAPRAVTPLLQPDPGVRRGGMAQEAPPLVTVHKVGSRVEVAAACPAARALGAAPGMALTQLRAAVPGIAVRDADAAGDRAALDRLAVTLARRWTPVVAVSDPDGLFLDLSGVAHLHGGEARMMRRLVRGLARVGIAARVGVADTTGAAWALARHATDAVAILPPGDPMPALAPFPVAALRIDTHALDLLRRLGIDTIGDLAALPRAPLARRFGRAVPQRLDQASGRVAEPLDPVVPLEPIAVAQRFAEPLMTAEPIACWLAQLVARLAVTLAQAGRGARAVALVATRVDAAVQVVRVGLARPTRAPDHLLRLLVRRIETIDPGFGIEGLALHVLRSDPLGAEVLAGDLTDDMPDLALLVDAIANRIGTTRLWRSRAVESDVPERAVARAAPLDPPVVATARLKHDDVRRLDARPPAHPWHPRWPRPIRLLLRPERIDHVIAELPDYPPLRFTWRGVTHRIVRGDGPERIAGEWWRRAAEGQAVRDYFRVEDDAGERFWLFRRGDGLHAGTGDLTWYMHGTFG